MHAIIEGIAGLQPHAVPAFISQQLERACPGRVVRCSNDGLIKPEPWAEAGHATVEPLTPFAQVAPASQHEDHLHFTPYVTAVRVGWQQASFELLTVTLPRGFEERTWTWVVGPDAASVDRFIVACAAWNSEVHGEVLVFENGCFGKDKALFRSIEASSLDDLTLAEGLASTLRTDLRRFLDSKATYAAAKLPWKRGYLFLGPPGNGKTHALRGLLRESRLPVIYVKSFTGRYVDPSSSIATVFSRARALAPCALVLEDLDALIDPFSRARLLNELDGFAQNEGLVTFASTNHPERLDPSLLHRPSRFDRKFTFSLPGAAERARYLERFITTLPAARRPAAAVLARLVEDTEGFTFAYLKEATLSTRVAAVELPEGESLGAVMCDVVAGLKVEVASQRPEEPARALAPTPGFPDFDG